MRRTGTNFYFGEEVFTASEPSHEKESIYSLMHLLGLFFDQVKNLKIGVGTSGIELDKGDSNLSDNGSKHLPAQQNAGNRKFAVDQTYSRVIGILHIETGEVKVFV
jgi:hypothetical protein